MWSNRSKKIYRTILLVGIMVSPVSSFLSIRFILLALAISFFISFTDFKLGKFFVFYFDSTFYLLVLVFGLLYSLNIRQALSLLETSFTLFALPLVFYPLKDFTEDDLHHMFYAFFLGLGFASVICFSNAIVEFVFSGNTQIFFFDKLTGIISSDPTYFSYYLVFAITFGLYVLYFDRVKRSRGFMVVILGFFFLNLMLTAGNTVFVSILLVLAFFILKFLTEPARTSYKTVVFTLAVFFLIAMFCVSYFDLNSFEGRNYWERFVLWEAAIRATPNILIGVGTGDYTSVLNDYYRSHNLSQFSVSNYNAHNQFIQTLLSNGILGLVALLIMMIRPLVLSIRYQSPLGILVFFSFFIYGLTEVFLGRYQGVFFFALMRQAFIAYFNSQSKALSVKEL